MRTLLRNAALWGMDLTEIDRLAEVVTADLADMLALGMRNAVATLGGKGA